MDFNVKKITDDIIKFIRYYYKKNNLKGAVIGISGGKDSAVVAGLFTKALGSDNVTGLWIPCHSNEEDKYDAIEVANYFGFELRNFDLTDMYDSFINQMKESNNTSEKDLIDTEINLKPRLRMTTLYAYAAMLSKVNNGGYLVCGTSNKCEMYVGYFTKGGDNVSDIRVLADLHVDEVIKIGDYLGVPHHIAHKTPDDGLSGKTDEEKLGFCYADVKKVIIEEETGIKDNTLDDETRSRILKSHQANLHKFNIPTFQK